VATANFTGDVTFEEPGLKACAGRLDYQPDKGLLALSLSTSAGLPTVAEEQVNIEAQAIDVALEGRAITGKGTVTTRMGSGTRCRPSTERTAAERGRTRMPGLLDQKSPVTIVAGSLTYAGASGKAVYGGPDRVVLTQGNTAIYADTISLDQAKGDLTATGNALANIALDGGDSIGKAHEIRYIDATRLITYAAPPAGYKAPAAPPGGAAVAREPQLQVPQGRITAGSRIEVRLAAEGAKLERITARTSVTMLQQTAEGSRTATGGELLQYDPAEKKFDMTAGGTALVRITDRSSPTSCREFTGRSLTFYESDDRIVIYDDADRSRTQIAPSACPASAR
jgi:lipopolysaccharide export system protein LptA